MAVSIIGPLTLALFGVLLIFLTTDNNNMEASSRKCEKLPEIDGKANLNSNKMIRRRGEQPSESNIELLDCAKLKAIIKRNYPRISNFKCVQNIESEPHI